MNLKYTLLVLVMIISMMKVNGQNYQSNVIPPDPVSAQFQKYLGYPVSYATGIPQINIPLYTMEASGVSIPFSLSYHASGIKVNQHQGVIGLGWSLFPGFKITRTIMGNPDDLFPTSTLDNLYQGLNSFDYLLDMTPVYSRGVNGDLSGGISARHDGQYDIFSIYLPNLNATFVLEWINGTLKATTIPQSSLKIELVGLDSQGHFSTFKVTDSNGVVYIFGSTNEYTEYSGDGSLGPSSWFLSEIDPPGSNNSIFFNYKPTNINVPFADFNHEINLYDTFSCYGTGCDYWDLFPYFSNIFSDMYFNTGSTLVPGSSEYEHLRYSYNKPYLDEISNSSPGSSYNNSNYFNLTIRSITYQSGEHIEFNYAEENTSNNEFYNNLDSILFYNTHNDVIKSVNIYRENKQLVKLSTGTNESYEFNYDSQAFDVYSLYQQDYLGLFNGKVNSSSLRNPKIVLNVTDQVMQNWNIGNIAIGEGDRTSDPIKAQARILKNIIYPTGGQTSFQYGLNQYNSYNGISYGLGLRIERMEIYDPISQKTMTKIYKYGKNESGVGNLTMPFLASYENGFRDAFVDENFHGVFSQTLWQDSDLGSYRERVLYGNSKYSASFEPLIWYDEVTEYSNEGKTVYNYEYTPSGYLAFNFPKFGSTAPRSYFTDVARNIGGEGPRLKSQSIFDAQNNLVQFTNNFYKTDFRYLKGIIIDTHEYWHDGDNKLYRYFTAYYDKLIVDNSILTDYSVMYNLELDNTKLSSTIQTDYLNGKEITTTTNFTYDDTYKYNLTSKSVFTSDGGTVAEKYYYPVGDVVPDLSSLSTAQQNMVGTLASNNYSTTVVEKEVEKNGVSLSKELFGYKDWGNSIYKPEQIYSRKDTAPFESKIRFNDYDDKGNIINFAKKDDVNTEYVWGYTDSYPVIKGVNVNGINPTSGLSTGYATLDGLLDNLTDIANNASQQALWNEYNGNIRSQYPGAMISTYTYRPQVGITSATDPKGNTIYYHYSADGKLEAVKNQDGAILSQYSYNYAPFGIQDPIILPYTGDQTSGGERTFCFSKTYEIEGNQGFYEGSPIFTGDALVGQSYSFSFAIKNTTLRTIGAGSTDITIRSIDLPEGFSMNTNLPVTISSGQSYQFLVTFTPTTVKRYAGYATIDMDSGDPYATDASLYFDFEGTNPNNSGPTKIVDMRYNGSSISTLDFGTVSGYNESTKTIQVYNTGNTTLNVTSIVSSDFSTFTLAGEYCFCSFSIAPGAYKNFDIIFHGAGGSESGLRTGTITINSDRTAGNNILYVSGTLTQ